MVHTPWPFAHLFIDRSFFFTLTGLLLDFPFILFYADARADSASYLSFGTHPHAASLERNRT